MYRPLATTLLLAGFTLLTGCEMLSGEPAEAIAARREADGKAVGGACRHAGRAIEDCYLLNKRADKAAIFAGWREMNDYMRENKIEAVAPQSVAAEAQPAAPVESVDVKKGAEERADAPAAKPGKAAKHAS